MVTIMVLATGIVLLYRSFLSALDYSNHLLYRAHALNIMETYIADFQRQFHRQNRISLVPRQRPVVQYIDQKKKEFELNFVLQPVTGLERCYRLQAAVAWRERGRDVRLQREVILSHFKMEDDL